MENLYAVIMAGGSGERFWPLSTQANPKQFLRLVGERSLLRLTSERITPLVPLDRQLVVAAQQHVVRIREELPGLPAANLILEPVGRNTAACIGLASLVLEPRDAGAIAVTLPADHHIPEPRAFIKVVEEAVRTAQDADVAVTIGLKPDRPETAYGYMQIGSAVSPGVYRVLRFHEKPDAKRARRYYSGKDYFWNTGIFVWRNRTVQRMIARHLPDHWTKLQKLGPVLGTSEYDQILKKVYPSLKKVSIDHGVLEKMTDILMVRGRFRWDDLGSWTALDRVLTKDRQRNIIVGKHVGIDTAQCIIYGRGEKIVATIGLRDFIVADTPHGLLICPKSRAQDVRELLAVMTGVVTARAQDAKSRSRRPARQ